MKRHATPDAASSKAAKVTTSPSTSAKTPDVFDVLGNDAINAARSGVEAASDTPLLSALEGKKAAEGPKVVRPAPDGPAAEVEDVSRPATVTPGMSGALIGGGDIEIRSGTTRRSRVVTTVPDGSACTVTDVKGAKIKVKVRVGKKNVEGWTSAAVFSDQPALARDEDDKKLMEDAVYSNLGGGMDNKAGDKPTSQGGLGDCFLIASIAAIGFASPEFADGMVAWDPKIKRYRVRFFQQVGRGKFEPVEILVDGYLPTSKTAKSDPKYAGDPGEPLWGAIIEKAYAKWKGGYDVVGEGGAGSEAMQEMTGVKSTSVNIGSLKEKDVVPFFRKAKADNLAIYAGVVDHVSGGKQTPFSGGGAGPYTGTLSQAHEWNEVVPGSVSIRDAGAGKAGRAWDTGEDGDKEGGLEGDNVKDGKVGYKDSSLSLEFSRGKGPKNPKDLEVGFQAHGVVLPSKMLIGNHAYGFQDVVNGDQLQFYNPWGSHQPKPITAAEFLAYFDSLATNAVPSAKTQS
jgi:hypothetical protein